MKFLFAVLLFTLIGVALSRILTEEMLLPSSRVCLTELGLGVETVLDNVDDDFITVEGNADLNKLCECVLRKENGVDANNSINLDGVKSILILYINTVNNHISDTEQAANDAMESCKDVKGDGLADQFIKIGNCFVRYIANI